MAVDFTASPFGADVTFGYLDRSVTSPRQLNPQVVLNTDSGSMLRTLREELRHCSGFSFSVAFVSSRAIALLKQELVEFEGTGRIVTSDYLGFTAPQAFAELLHLGELGIDARLHREHAYHPKGYIFEYPDRVTAILGSSNLTASALVRNHEWNLKVTASRDSDLAEQLAALVSGQISDSVPLSSAWIEAYAAAYTTASSSAPRVVVDRPLPDPVDTSVASPVDLPPYEAAESLAPPVERLPGPPRETVAISTAAMPLPAAPAVPPPLTPNRMQQEALLAIDAMRRGGHSKALVISATGTGKTILSALDVRAFNPERMLFVVHREQILDSAIEAFKRVLGAPASDFGKLSGTAKQHYRKYVFATIQTLSRPDTLAQLDPTAFDYILIDEVHRAGAASYARVIDHFSPAFLLGMTATPERTDGVSVFELFDYNVPYEIRLNRALEDEMLSPFHYYGVTDVEFEDGTTTTEVTEVARLASRVRVEHVLGALNAYAQAGIQPRGLMFCSRKDEAHALSHALNQCSFRGRSLRTVALTGDDSIERREEVVEKLESGELDYILTVDIFNEGVDIPSINQVVMLRQTQSSIVFVQQLGRGLRLHPEKEYLVVIDFIGNYSNNYLIPIALFGDDSLNKESLRKNLIAAEETGVLAGLSSVRFDQISQARVLKSIVETKLDSMQNLKSALETMRNRVGGVPSLHDFWRFESVDPVLLATKQECFPELVRKTLKVDHHLRPRELRALCLLSNEAMAAKRPHELLVLRALLSGGATTKSALADVLAQAGAASSQGHVDSALRTFTLEFHTEAEQKKYLNPIVKIDEDTVDLAAEFRESYADSWDFSAAVDDLVKTGLELIAARYDPTQPFTPGSQYSRKDACRLLCWNKNVMATIYGYKVDKHTDTCPIFVTYHKDEDITASTAYEDELLDPSTMLWYTRSRRTLRSEEVASIVGHRAQPFVFAKKNDAEGSDFYFLGAATASNAEETTMPDDHGNPLDVVRMHLRFEQPIQTAVYDYFHPVVMV